jgi:trigger factor
MIQTDMRRLETENFQEYQNTVGKTEKQLREQLEPQAKERVKRTLVLDKIASEEKLTVSPDEISGEIAIMLEETAENQRPKLKQTLESSRGRETIGNLILTRKTIAQLARLAKGKVESTVAGPANTKEEEKK